MTKIVHLIPYDGIGGVESAARSMGCLKHGAIEFEINFIFGQVNCDKRNWKTFSPAPLISAAQKYASGNVDILIVSLWRSCIVGLIAKLLRPRLPLIVFLHSSKDVHLFDRVATRKALALATETWADSEATLAMRVPAFHVKRTRIISFVTRYCEATPSRPVEPSFSFWGRLSSSKRLDRAIRIFAAIRQRRPLARFRIIGPDGGSLRLLKVLCGSLGITDAVVFSGGATHDEISRLAMHASFYLQTSAYEGMAMSVVEAMQMGLVPVVTAVGEIGAYCRNGYNSVLVESDHQVVEDILHLLDSNSKYQEMRSKAIATWKDHPIYRESMLNACQNLLAGGVTSADRC